MTQTIAHSSSDELQHLYAADPSLLSSHAQIASILRNRLGPFHAQLFATPVLQSDGAARWETTYDGEVVAATALDADRAAALRARADALTEDIRRLATSLAERGASSLLVANLLGQALQAPAADSLFSVGGQPVIAKWGVGARPQFTSPVPAAPTASPPSRPVPPSLAAEVAAPATVAATTAADATTLASTTGADGTAHLTLEVVHERSRWWPWIALLALMAVLLLLGVRRCTPTVDPTQLAIVERQNQVFEDELKRRKGADSRYACVVDPPAPKASAPEPAASAPEPAPSAPEPAPSAPPMPASAAELPPSVPAKDPYEDLAKRVAKAKTCEEARSAADDPLLKNKDAEAEKLRKTLKDRMDSSCKQERIKEALDQCPGERPPELAPELALVFDASGSMRFSLNATPQELQRMSAYESMGNMAGGGFLGALLRGQAQKEFEHATREPQRIGPARDAAGRLVTNAPSDVSIGMVMVDSCSTGARSEGFFSPGRRGELLDRIRRIEPKEGTPLGDGIAKAGAMLDGVNRESVMVVISDGEENCGANPCAIAAELARTKPHLKINVIDITGAGAGNCLAKATGGRVYTANSADDITKMVHSAGKDALGPQNCKKP